MIIDQPGTWPGIQLFNESLVVRANDVTLVDPLLIGPQHKQPAYEQVGVDVRGHHCRIVGGAIYNWGGSAILASGVSGLRIDGTDIRDCNYAGIQLVDCWDYEVARCVVRNIVGNAPHAYGIADTSTEVRTKPCGVIVGNVVIGVPHHEGLDTHGGLDLVFADNTVSYCNVGATIGVNSHLGQVLSAARRVEFNGNKLMDCATGLLVAGSNGKFVEEFVAYDNTIAHCGDHSQPYNGACQFKYTLGAKLLQGYILKPRRHGVVIYHDNKDFRGDGVVVLDQGFYGYYVTDRTNDGVLRDCKTIYQPSPGKFDKRIAVGARFTII